MFAWLTKLLDAINMIVWLGTTGFIAGAASLLAGRLVGGLKAYLVAGGVGTLLVLGTHWSGIVDRMVSERAKAEIAQIKGEKVTLEKERDALAALLEKEREQAAKDKDIIAANEATFAKLSAITAAHAKDTAECPGIAAFADELEAIGELK